MELTKRMKSSLIQSILANIVLFVVFLWAVFIFILPKIQEFWSQKQELRDAHSYINQIEKEWLSYGDFKTWIAAQRNDDAYVRTLLQNIDPKFYVDNFTNTSTNDYTTFLKGVEKKIFDIKSSEDFVKKEQTMDYVLPFYNKNNTFSEEGLTDFHFTNYIENLIYTFNLEAKWAIGIWTIQKVWEADVDLTEPNSLEEGIFAIPLDFEVTWQKTDVIDFIHFFENVWSIEIDEWNINVYSDKFISKVLEGDKPSPLYNIYRNHIADVSSVIFVEYPDSSSLKTNKNLVELMKTDQAREKITVKVELQFYVAGVPWYKIEKYINSFLDDFEMFLEQVSLNVKKYTAQAYKFSKGDQIHAIGSLQSIESLLLQLNEDTINLRKEMLKKENIQELYNTAVEYREKLTTIQELYDSKVALLNLSN